MSEKKQFWILLAILIASITLLLYAMSTMGQLRI